MYIDLTSIHREALLAEMGVAMREDGGTVGVFSPKKVRQPQTPPRICSDILIVSGMILTKMLVYLPKALR